MDKLTTISDIGGFLIDRKKYWLLPVVVMLALLGLVIVVGESSALGPFVYPFF